MSVEIYVLLVLSIAGFSVLSINFRTALALHQFRIKEMQISPLFFAWIICLSFIISFIQS